MLQSIYSEILILAKYNPSAIILDFFSLVESDFYLCSENQFLK